MSKFKKTCFKCGKKTENLIESMCEDCFKEQYPPIKNLKPINAKYCNMCNRINFLNRNISQEEFKSRLPQIIKKNLILDEHYNLKKVIIKNFSIKANKVEFEFEVNCDIKNQ